jgi:inner membrane protease subunit 1
VRRRAALVGVVAGALLAARWWRRSQFALAVAGGSMEPALMAGDWLVARRGAPRGGRATGAVVCVRGPDGRLLVKRVAAGPGEPRAAAGHRTSDAEAGGVLSADEYFVVGDRLEASTDSRQFGPVRGWQIEGVAWLRYWPPGRFGRVVRVPPGAGW